MGSLRRLQSRARKRCARGWSEEGRGVDYWHTCVRPPGHPDRCSCTCGARLAQAEEGAA